MEDALLARAVEILEDNGPPGDRGAHHRARARPARIARDHIDRGADLILAAGGDGTINEVAEGMVHSAGAAGRSARRHRQRAGHGDEAGRNRLERVRGTAGRMPCPRRISVGHVTCDGGARIAPLPADGGRRPGRPDRLPRETPALKARVGKLAYWVAGWSLLGRRLPQFQVDGATAGSAPCSFALLSKVRNYGGDFEIARHVTLFDDHFEVVLFEGRPPPATSSTSPGWR